jgi:hypothetical protein
MMVLLTHQILAAGDNVLAPTPIQYDTWLQYTGSCSLQTNSSVFIGTNIRELPLLFVLTKGNEGRPHALIFRPTTYMRAVIISSYETTICFENSAPHLTAFSKRHDFISGWDLRCDTESATASQKIKLSKRSLHETHPEYSHTLCPYQSCQ